MLDLAALKVRAANRMAKSANVASLPSLANERPISQLAALADFATPSEDYPAARKAALVIAIEACCDARGDDDANRAGLLADAALMNPAEQRDMTEHFSEQAAIWRRVTGRCSDQRAADPRSPELGRDQVDVFRRRSGFKP